MAEHVEGIVVDFGASTVKFDAADARVNKSLRNLGNVVKTLDRQMKFDGKRSPPRVRGTVNMTIQQYRLS
jgi:hypothetical protein